MVDGISLEGEFDIGGNSLMANEILLKPDAHATRRDSNAFGDENIVGGTKLRRCPSPCVAVGLRKAFKAIVCVEVETWHGGMKGGWMISVVYGYNIHLIGGQFYVHYVYLVKI